MRQMKRKSRGVIQADHENRIQTLERRVFPVNVVPCVTASANWLTETLHVGNFVNMGLDFASTNDPLTFTHLPLVDGWVENDTTAIDGAVVILQRGIYDVFVQIAGLSSVPSDTQTIDISIRSIDIDDPLGTPTPSGSWSAVEVVGTHAAPPSLAHGNTIISNADWANIRLSVGSTSTLKPTGVKPYIGLSGAGSNLAGCTVQMMIWQVATMECNSSDWTVITGDGFAQDYEDLRPCSS